MNVINDSTLLLLLNKQYKSIENGLLYGKAGLSLYYARLSSMDKTYKSTYNRLINDILKDVCSNTPIEFSRGLLGIGIAIDIILKFYKTGSSDYVLEEIDAYIYKTLDVNNQKSMVDIDLALEGLFYISLHLRYGIKNKTKREIFIKKAKSLLEYVYSVKQYDIFKEPIPAQLFTKEFFFLYSLFLLHEQGIYVERINHMCNELIYKLISSTPVLQFNKLKRVFLVSKILTTVNNLADLWIEHRDAVISQISIQQLTYEDFKDKQLHLTDGLTGMCILMEKINECFEHPKFDVPWDYYYTKVQNSSINEELSKECMPIYNLGINGFWGINYCLEKWCKGK